MLKIRLQRVGKKNNPSYRVVLTEHQNSTKSGKFLEILGNHDFRTDKGNNLKVDRIKHWMSKGAQVTPTVHNLLVKAKVISGKTVNVLPKKSPIKKEEEKTEEAPKAEGEATPESTNEAPADAPKEEAPQPKADEPAAQAPEPKGGEKKEEKVTAAK